VRAILTWHSIDESGSPISVSPAEFGRQVAWLRASGVPVLTVADLLASPADRPAVALTFDDGFANFASEAAPRLFDQGWPVTLFVVSGHVGQTNQWGGRPAAGVPELPLLDWDAVARLDAAGVEIAAHTRTHPRLDQVADSARLADELEGCARDIAQRLGRRPTGLAYPYGAVSSAATAAAATSFAWACTTDLRALAPVEASHRLPRVDAWYLRNPERLGRWGSPRLRRWLWWRRGGRRLKALLQPAGVA